MKSQISLLNSLSPIAEGFRRMRTNIQFSRPDKPTQVIVFTSSGPGEGKTVSSTNLAITMAQAGCRTVYVDTDLRRSTGHQVMGVNREPGLIELLFDDRPIDFERFTSEIDDLYIIPSGKAVPNPAEILGSHKMRDFITRLRNSFEVVVLDSPPSLAVTDALLLASESDAVVLVVSANQTTWQAVEQSIENLADVGASLVGMLVNRFDPKEAYAGYGYGYGYGHKK